MTVGAQAVSEWNLWTVGGVISDANPAQKRMIDDIEVRRQVAPALRVAFEVNDAATTTRALAGAGVGAEELAPPTRTPRRSVNARLQAPAGLQITVFHELEAIEDRAARPGFRTKDTDSSPRWNDGYPPNMTTTPQDQ